MPAVHICAGATLVWAPCGFPERVNGLLVNEDIRSPLLFLVTLAWEFFEQQPR